MFRQIFGKKYLRNIFSSWKTRVGLHFTSHFMQLNKKGRCWSWRYWLCVVIVLIAVTFFFVQERLGKSISHRLEFIYSVLVFGQRYLSESSVISKLLSDQKSKIPIQKWWKTFGNSALSSILYTMGPVEFGAVINNYSVAELKAFN